jgi:hypothetical protein
VEANSTGGQDSRRAVALSDDDDDDLHKLNINNLYRILSSYRFAESQILASFLPSRESNKIE